MADKGAPGQISGWENIKPETLAFMRKKGWEAKTKLKKTDLMIFTRQFATLVDAGVPIDQALSILGKATKNQQQIIMTYELHRIVMGGTTLSEAMEKFKLIFSEMYASMMKVAEVTGDLPGVLLELATSMEAAEEIRTKVKSAMTYPMISLTMVLAIATGLVVFIVPRFEAMFELIEGSLPLPTAVLLSISHAIRQNGLAVFFGTGAFIYTVKRLARTERGRYLVDTVKFKAPVFGAIVQQSVLANFCRTFGTLLRCGVPILKSLEIVKKTVNNKLMEIAIDEVAVSVRSGGTLAEVFEKQEIVPLMVTRMIDIGERTGQIESLLEKVTSFYEDRVKAAIDGMTSLIEPMLVALLGTVVGGIMMAIFMPIIQIAGSVGR